MNIERLKTLLSDLQDNAAIGRNEFIRVWGGRHHD